VQLDQSVFPATRGRLQQQLIAIDSDPVNETSGGRARVQYLLPESEVGNVPTSVTVLEEHGSIRYHSQEVLWVDHCNQNGVDNGQEQRFR
jgi:hypothetical protein